MIVTAFYAGLMGLWMLFLGFQVVRQRRRHDISTGDGGVRALELAIRAHGNACEYIPIALILIGAAESMGAPGWLLHSAGLTLSVGRVLHGVCFLAGGRPLNLRVAGMVMTVGVIGALAFGVILRALSRLI